MAYRGGLITVGLWLLLLGVVVELKMRNANHRDALPRYGYREQAMGLLRALRQASTRLTVLLLLLYLFIVPGALLQAEQSYQQQVWYDLHSGQWNQRFAQEVQRLRASEPEMQSIREWIQKQEELEASL